MPVKRSAVRRVFAPLRGMYTAEAGVVMTPEVTPSSPMVGFHALKEYSSPKGLSKSGWRKKAGAKDYCMPRVNTQQRLKTHMS